MSLYIVQVEFWVELLVQMILYPILLNYGSIEHNGVVSSYMISTDIS